MSLEEARRRTELITSQYTKRQATWFRHHVLASQTRTFLFNARISYETQFSERKWHDLIMFIQNGLDQHH
jgi:tRNA dimethylallyltransferase